MGEHWNPLEPRPLDQMECDFFRPRKSEGTPSAPLPATRRFRVIMRSNLVN